MGDNLKNRTISGIGWSSAEALLGQGVSFIVSIVLARLLSPSEYGLVGICTIFITVLSGIVDSGFSNALIRQKDTSNDDYNTMFVTNMVMSIVLFVGLYFCAPLIAVFFEREELVDLIRVMGLLLIIQALTIVQNTVLTKRIDFKTKTKATVLASVISGIVGIGMAVAGFGVWSLVGRQGSYQIINTISLWTMNKWWPSLSFNIGSFKYMWGYGWKMMTAGLLNRIWSQLYQVVVGKFYSPATLGQYTRAKDFASLFSSNFTKIIQRVTFPTLAEIQDDKTRMVSAYRKMIKTSMFITAVCLISIGAISEPLIFCLIGPKWHQAATFLPLICILMSLYPLHAINLNMLQVQGRSDLFLYLEIIKHVIAIIPICVGIFVGIYSMLCCSLVTGFISFLLNSWYSGPTLGYSSWKQLKDVAPSYGLSLVIALSVYFLKYLPISYYIILPIQIIVGVGVFFLVCEKTKMEEYLEVKAIASQYISKIKKR